MAATETKARSAPPVTMRPNGQVDALAFLQVDVPNQRNGTNEFHLYPTLCQTSRLTTLGLCHAPPARPSDKSAGPLARPKTAQFYANLVLEAPKTTRSISFHTMNDLREQDSRSEDALNSCLRVLSINKKLGVQSRSYNSAAATSNTTAQRQRLLNMKLMLYNGYRQRQEAEGRLPAGASLQSMSPQNGAGGGGIGGVTNVPVVDLTGFLVANKPERQVGRSAQTPRTSRPPARVHRYDVDGMCEYCKMSQCPFGCQSPRFRACLASESAYKKALCPSSYQSDQSLLCNLDEIAERRRRLEAVLLLKPQRAVVHNDLMQ